MAIEIPTLKSPKSGIRHAAVLRDNRDWKHGDALFGYPSQVLYRFCDWSWQSANNYYRLPVQCVECKKCQAKSRLGMAYLMGILGVDLKSVYQTFDEIPFGGPESDQTEKLVFADFLDEQGDPRGEWVRIAVELGTSARSESLARVAMLNRALEIKRELCPQSRPH